MPKAEGGIKLCSKCKKKKSLNMFIKDKFTLDGLCYQCKSCQKEWRIENSESERIRGKYWRDNNKEHCVKHNKERTKNIKQKVIDAYGCKCVCKHKKGICGEAAFEFLSIQHKDGSGGKHTKALGGPN